jgi:hypothetical protein
MEVDVLEGVIDRLATADPFSYSDPDSVIALQRAVSRLAFIAANAVASFDAGGEWALDGAKTSVAWLDTRCHLPKKEGHRQLRRGRSLAHMEHTAAAWACGDIGAAQVDILAKVRTPRTEEAYLRDEELLVRHAKEMKVSEFGQVAHYWRLHADPDGAAESEMERLARRDVFMSQGIDATWAGTFTLDPIGGTIVSREHRRVEQEFFEADWAQAKARLGREPKVHELARTPAQRRADALVEMATRSASVPADGRRPRPLFSFFIGYEAFKGRISQLAEGKVLSADSLLGWLAGADFERVLFRPGQRVEVSETARLFTGATRRAIELRDQQCTDPYCDIPAEQCQIDHIIPHTKGGLTTQENGEVCCGFHNRWRYGQQPPDGPDG